MTDFVHEARVIFRYELEEQGLTTGAFYVAAHDVHAHAAASAADYSPVRYLTSCVNVKKSSSLLIAKRFNSS